MDNESSLFFLDTCARIEEQCAELYHYYSLLFSSDYDIAHLWKKTALEEEEHCKQIQLAMKFKEEISSLMPEGLEQSYSVFQKMQRLVDGVKSNPPDLITALKKSIEMEERLAFLHIDSSVKFRDTSLQQMFNALKSADNGHIALLKRQLAIATLADTEMRG